MSNAMMEFSDNNDDDDEDDEDSSIGEVEAYKPPV